MLLKKAAQFLKEKNYEDAYELYQKASEIYGYQLVSYNIKLCEEIIKKNNSKSNSKREKKIINSFLNKYFDHVYVVNLENAVNDKMKVSNHLKQNGINFEIFKATNGYEGDAYKKYEEYCKRPIGDFKRYTEYSDIEKKRGSPLISSAGAMGYIHTYINIFKDAKKNQYKRFLILEDDILLANNFEEKFKTFINNIKDDWKILQLGASQYSWEKIDTEESRKKGFYFPTGLDTCGSFAMACDLSIVDEFIECQASFESPFDFLPMSEIYTRYKEKCYISYPNIIVPDVSTSSIRGGRSQSEHSKKMKWEMNSFNFPLSKPSIAIIISNKENLKYYNNFSCSLDMPFNLRIFFYSEKDGFRPFHSLDIFETQKCTKELPKVFDLPQADYYAKIESNEVLSESGIVSFLEYKTGIIKKNKSNLVEINNQSKTIQKNRISVIIPTFKRPKNLKNALHSVLCQNYPDIEIIVINDTGKNSKYNKLIKDVILTSEKKSNCILKYIEHDKNRNGAAARNTGFLNSTGEYISFLDDDDIYFKNRLLHSIKILKQTEKTIGAVYCGFIGWNSNEHDLNRYKKGDLTLEILSLDYKKHYLCSNTGTYKREAILKINGFDESYRRHQDLEFNLRFFEEYNIEILKECLVQLYPEPSDIRNTVEGMTMLRLKEKFLKQFAYKINNYDQYTKDLIYDVHWNEARRYVNNLDYFSMKILEDKKIGVTQILKNKITTNNKKLRVFPIGTSRLHEPMSLFSENEVSFPGLGYFHSPMQICDLIDILMEKKILSKEECKFFFRKDQIPKNIFNLEIWDDSKYIEVLKNVKKLFEEADFYVIEISAMKSWLYNEIHIQGNPNYYNNIPYADVWKKCYYKQYHPDLNIQNFEKNKIEDEIKYINNFLVKANKKALILGHLVDPNNPNKHRVKLNSMIKESIEGINNSNLTFYNTMPLVEEYGFRILENGTTDIHHLPWNALEKQAKDMRHIIIDLL